jgi:hypothetical protein
MQNITEYLKILHELETARFNINLKSTITIFIGYSLSLPVFSSLPVTALLGAVLFFAGTLYSFIAIKRNNADIKSIGKGCGDAKNHVISSPSPLRPN